MRVMISKNTPTRCAKMIDWI